jgi:predicted anti-sigma-YlaC factor YlaD
MSTHLSAEQLQDHADGALTSEDHALVERHLAICTACAAESFALHALLADLAALPGVAPARDLLPGIAARIDAETIPAGEWTLMRARPWLAAAAALLVVLSASLTWLLTRPAVPAGTEARPLASAEADAFLSTDAEYARAAAELETLLRINRAALEPEVAQVLEHTLATIDMALTEAREALARDPDNALLSGLLLASHEKKLDVLRQAAGLASL